MHKLWFFLQFHSDGSAAVFFVKSRKSAVALQKVSGRLTLPDSSKVVGTLHFYCVVLCGNSGFRWLVEWLVIPLCGSVGIDQGSGKPRFLKKAQPAGFYWVLGFIGFIGIFLFERSIS